MKKFSVPCDFGGKQAPFDVFIGNPKEGNHPLLNQSNWLQSERGGTISPDIWESFAKLLDLSSKNNVPFEDLCAYALEKSNQNKSDEIQAQPSQATTAPSVTQNKAATEPTQPMRVATAKVPASQVPDSDPNKQKAISQAQQQPQPRTPVPSAQPVPQMQQQNPVPPQPQDRVQSRPAPPPIPPAPPIPNNTSSELDDN